MLVICARVNSHTTQVVVKKYRMIVTSLGVCLEDSWFAALLNGLDGVAASSGERHLQVESPED